jgi:2'-5' RNA ligase
MSFAFELHFDDRTDTAVRRIWTHLAAAGFDTRLNGIAPHVTLAIASAFDESLAAPLRQFSREHPPFGITFRSIGRFPSGVLFLSPDESNDLRGAHRDFHMRFTSLAPAPNSHFYAPDRWIPHCTLAMRAPPELVLDSLVQPGSLRRLRVVEYPALTLHLDCPLGEDDPLS